MLPVGRLVYDEHPPADAGGTSDFFEKASKPLQGNMRKPEGEKDQIIRTTRLPGEKVDTLVLDSRAVAELCADDVEHLRRAVQGSDLLGDFEQFLRPDTRARRQFERLFAR